MSNEKIDKIDSEIMKFCDEQSKKSERRGKEIKKLARKETDEKIRLLLTLAGQTLLRVSFLLKLGGYNLLSIKQLSVIIEKLPERKEIDQLKAEAKEDKKRVLETLIPIRKLVEDSKELNKRGEDIYG